jgi:hypothetical protein
MSDTRITRLASETAGTLVDAIPGFLGMTPDPWPYDADELLEMAPRHAAPRNRLVSDVAKVITAALTDLARQIREEDAPYMTHKGDCRALYPIHDDCTCGLTALRARTEEGS